MDRSRRQPNEAYNYEAGIKLLIEKAASTAGGTL
jgi:hypothetical protein